MIEVVGFKSVVVEEKKRECGGGRRNYRLEIRKKRSRGKSGFNIPARLSGKGITHIGPSGSSMGHMTNGSGTMGNYHINSLGLIHEVIRSRKIPNRMD